MSSAAWRIKTTDANGAESLGDVHHGPDARNYLTRHAEFVAKHCYESLQFEGDKVRVGKLTFEIVSALPGGGGT